MTTQSEQPLKVLDDTKPCNYLDDIRTCCSLHLGFEVYLVLETNTHSSLPTSPDGNILGHP